MILSIKATRKSKDMQDMPDARGGRGSQIFEFEVPWPGPAPTVIVDCGSSHAFDMFQVRGEKLPRRPCPLRPKGEAAGPDGPPVSWIDPTTGRLKVSVFQPKLSPSDLFAVVGIGTCNDCPMAMGGTVGIEDEQNAIIAAFDKQLRVENFTGFEQLGNDDRNVAKWKIMWDEISIVSE